MGSSAAAIGAAAAAAVLANGRLGAALVTLVCGYVLITAPFLRFDVNVSHCVAVIVGVGLGSLLGRAR